MQQPHARPVPGPSVARARAKARPHARRPCRMRRTLQRSAAPRSAQGRAAAARHPRSAAPRARGAHPGPPAASGSLPAPATPARSRSRPRRRPRPCLPRRRRAPRPPPPPPPGRAPPRCLPWPSRGRGTARGARGRGGVGLAGVLRAGRGAEGCGSWPGNRLWPGAGAVRGLGAGAVGRRSALRRAARCKSRGTRAPGPLGPVRPPPRPQQPSRGLSQAAAGLGARPCAGREVAGLRVVAVARAPTPFPSPPALPPCCWPKAQRQPQHIPPCATAGAGRPGGPRPAPRHGAATAMVSARFAAP
jgi:hypothetical protein